MREVSKTKVGAFVVGALAIVVLGILVLGSGRLFREQREIVMYFEGSVGGLSVGAPVVFKGVQIGSVSSIQLIHDEGKLEFSIPVRALIEPDRLVLTGEVSDRREQDRRLVEKGLRARLGMQSFVTGQLMVELDLHPDEPAVFRGDGSISEIPTIPTPMEKLKKTLENLPLEETMRDIAAAAKGVQELANSADIRSAIASLADAMASAREVADVLNREIGPITADLRKALESVTRLADSANADVHALSGKVGEAVDRVSGSVEGTLSEYADLANSTDVKLGKLAEEIGASVAASGRALEQAVRALEDAREALKSAPKLAEQLSALIAEISSAARAVRGLAVMLERRPEALLRGKGGPEDR